ncbi:unnamed protein product, partial [Allacma fusca]
MQDILGKYFQREKSENFKIFGKILTGDFVDGYSFDVENGAAGRSPLEGGGAPSPGL